MGVWDIFVAEFKSGILGLYAGWLAIPTLLAVLAAGVLGLVWHLSPMTSIIALSVFALLAMLELPVLTNWVAADSITGSFLKLVRKPISKALFYAVFAGVFWLTIPSLLSVHIAAAFLLTITAVLNLSAALKREASIERYCVQRSNHICSKLKGGQGISPV